ncbi:MAG TPA: type II toxin-antitoxin system PrlF family antitoxin, partial [Devosia sp.]|nr:type II toxin-antitoxin system PrlF family antitoxin [Devosia sp.]
VVYVYTITPSLQTLAGGKEVPYFGRMITSKLTTKAQTTIPQPVRAALGLREGDEIAYEIEGRRVILTRAGSIAADDPFATFEEWSSEADERAYADL